MTIRHLRLFIAVVDYKTMSNAAKKMYISQPSVSQSIREIEEYYNIRLFERLSQRLYLTLDGEKLLKYARNIVNTFENMELEFRNKFKSIFLRIGGSLTFGTYMLPEILTDFERKYPNVQTRIMVDNTTIIEKKLLNNEIDIGIVEGEIESSDILKVPIYKDKMVIVTSFENSFFNKPEIDITELSGFNMIARDEGCIERSQFQRFLNENNVEVSFKWNCTSVETIKNALKKSNAFSALSLLAIKEEVERKELKILKIKDVNLHRDLCLVYHKNKFLNEETRYFIQLCQKFNKKDDQ